MPADGAAEGRAERRQAAGGGGCRRRKRQRRRSLASATATLRWPLRPRCPVERRCPPRSVAARRLPPRLAATRRLPPRPTATADILDGHIWVGAAPPLARPPQKTQAFAAAPTG
ncbi:Os09g0373100 [Oryza sativa Japonica Group]|uniref:Os09g0373050 protein n=2 Tax=Oryza sativa subsp. japonica TaxID=39947 RepID=A0A0P0XKX2_ORYSJ|nr:hypothetical protein EE612_047413 [Oryza sativa]BAD26368.1 unknown protein [Oryza sativa Japonica Group]BAH94534.1 Os09g0373050 [Oryza sativa Japonica Group]BAT07789.1 Os09g0373100 [Oryza sativa Japonica Group]|eukprot:NP_001175806.1 Os09g0373050 [Oryza sativa Japonica Group]